MANNIALDGNLNVGGSEVVSGGQTFGDNTADTIGFYGVTPVGQPTSSEQASAVGTALASISATQWGFATSTQGDTLVKEVNAMRAALVSLGLIKGS